jgi:hypothetical protein
LDYIVQASDAMKVALEDMQVREGQNTTSFCLLVHAVLRKSERFCQARLGKNGRSGNSKRKRFVGVSLCLLCVACVQVAHRQTEGQLAQLAKKTDAQLGQLLKLVQGLSEQVVSLQETANSNAAAVAAVSTAAAAAGASSASGETVDDDE